MKKILLRDDELPKSWYNVVPDIPNGLRPPLDPDPWPGAFLPGPAVPGMLSEAAKALSRRSRSRISSGSIRSSASRSSSGRGADMERPLKYSAKAVSSKSDSDSSRIRTALHSW